MSKIVLKSLHLGSSITRLVLNKRSVLVVVAFALLFLSFNGRMVSGSSPANTTMIQSSITWNFMQGKSTGDSYFLLTVAAYGPSANSMPNHVSLSFSALVNGTRYFDHGCSFKFDDKSNQSYDSCTFNAPYRGNGSYDFVAILKDNSGRVVSQTMIDTSSSPQWNISSMQTSMEWNFVQGKNAGDSYFVVTVDAFGQNASSLPRHLSLTLYSITGGSRYFDHNCDVKFDHGSDFSCDVKVPFHGNGNYDFVAVFKDASGRIVAQIDIDPHAEPEWR